jgi:hypothetical protein
MSEGARDNRGLDESLLQNLRAGIRRRLKEWLKRLFIKKALSKDNKYVQVRKISEFIFDALSELPK